MAPVSTTRNPGHREGSVRAKFRIALKDPFSSLAQRPPKQRLGRVESRQRPSCRRNCLLVLSWRLAAAQRLRSLQCWSAARWCLRSPALRQIQNRPEAQRLGALLERVEQASGQLRKCRKCRRCLQKVLKRLEPQLLHLVPHLVGGPGPEKFVLRNLRQSVQQCARTCMPQSLSPGRHGLACGAERWRRSHLHKHPQRRQNQRGLRSHRKQSPQKAPQSCRCCPRTALRRLRAAWALVLQRGQGQGCSHQRVRPWCQCQHRRRALQRCCRHRQRVRRYRWLSGCPTQLPHSMWHRRTTTRQCCCRYQKVLRRRWFSELPNQPPRWVCGHRHKGPQWCCLHLRTVLKRRPAPSAPVPVKKGHWRGRQNQRCRLQRRRHRRRRALRRPPAVGALVPAAQALVSVQRRQQRGC